MDTFKKNLQSEDSRCLAVTITGRNSKVVEEMCSGLVERCQNNNLSYSGPMRLPTRKLKITTRKTPCGNGSNTWDTFEMRLFKRVFRVTGNIDKIRMAVNLEPSSGVDISVAVLDDTH